LGNDDAGAPSRVAHGRRIVHAEPLHQPAEDVAALVADEAVIATLLRNDREVAVGAAMERTRSPVVGAGPLELHRLADDPDQVGALAHQVDGLVGDHAHAENSTMVTPVPPGWRGAKEWLRIRLSRDTIRRTRSRTTPVPIP